MPKIIDLAGQHMVAGLLEWNNPLLHRMSTLLADIDEISAIREFLEIATCLRRLELTVDSLTPRYAKMSAIRRNLTSRPMTPTHHSLLYALSTCLAYVKQRLTFSIEDNSREGQADWNRCGSGNKDIRALLGVLCDIIQWASPPCVNR